MKSRSRGVWVLVYRLKTPCVKRCMPAFSLAFRTLWHLSTHCSDCVKIMIRPSTKLRANGNYIDNIDNCPFVLRLSKHERIFSHTLSPRVWLGGRSGIRHQQATRHADDHEHESSNERIPNAGVPRGRVASPWSRAGLKPRLRSASVEPGRRQWLDAASLRARRASA